MNRAAPALAILMLLVLPVAPATDTARVEPFALTVDGETATGLVAFPAGAAKGLVVIARGYGHTSASHAGHLMGLAEAGYAAVAMDFRGDTAGFPLATGAADTIAATQALLPLVPADGLVVLYSVSMGTAVAGIVLAELPVFDYWVNNEGLAMLHETWAGATALSPSGNPTAVNAVKDIEAETGGTPAEVPLAYAQRSAVVRAAEFSGLKGVILTHGLNDGLVPYDQGREMVGALRALGIPSDFYTAVRGNAGGEGTTLTGYLGQNIDGLAGHGTESNDAHTLTALSFGLLHDLLNGAIVPADRELVVDRELGTLP